MTSSTSRTRLYSAAWWTGRFAAERAWTVPAVLRERLGTFEMDELVKLDEEAWLRVMRQPPSPHRLTDVMATVLYRATQRVASHYGSDASLIWSDTPSSASLVRRFLEFYGAGPKIATMAANILVRQFHVPLRDFRYIDISADVQVRRVMARLGFVKEGASPEVVIYAHAISTPTTPVSSTSPCGRLAARSAARLHRSAQNVGSLGTALMPLEAATSGGSGMNPTDGFVRAGTVGHLGLGLTPQALPAGRQRHTFGVGPFAKLRMPPLPIASWAVFKVSGNDWWEDHPTGQEAEQPRQTDRTTGETATQG